MYHHAPSGYNCPICLGIKQQPSDHTLIVPSDIIFLDQEIIVFIGSYFIGDNAGNIIISPVDHYENIYDLPPQIASRIMLTSQKYALLMKKAYGCDGITIQQNNEPASGQHAFHYHLHLFPRYNQDTFYDHILKKRTTTPAQRLEYVEKIKQAEK